MHGRTDGIYPTTDKNEPKLFAIWHRSALPRFGYLGDNLVLFWFLANQNQTTKFPV
jgi:hypothetical protein